MCVPNRHTAPVPLVRCRYAQQSTVTRHTFGIKRFSGFHIGRIVYAMGNSDVNTGVVLHVDLYTRTASNGHNKARRDQEGCEPPPT